MKSDIPWKYEFKTKVAVLLSNKVDFKSKKITRDIGLLQNVKRIIPPRRHDLKYVCTKQQSLKLHEAKADRAERRNRPTIIFAYLNIFLRKSAMISEQPSQPTNLYM